MNFLLFFGILCIPIFYYISKNKKIFEILKNDPFLLFRITRDNLLYYYRKKYQKTGISELRVFDKFYELDYTYNGVNYTKRFHKVVGPSTLNIIKIYTIKNGLEGQPHEIEVTDKVTPYMGVNKDFHAATPSLLGYENLHFVTEDISEETTDIINFEKNQTIRL